MGFVGTRSGPRKSEIVAKLGPGYFGITPDQLAVEIDFYQEDELQGVVDPVYVDSKGRRFLRFNAPDGGIQRLYLEENGYHLPRDVEEIPTEENG